MKSMLLNKKAAWFRKVSGSSDLEKTVNKVVEKLNTAGIPSLVVGGFALQEYNYPRFTSDVDLLVSNVPEAREYLSIRGFKPNVGSSMTLTDRETGVEVDLLPGGGKVDSGPLDLPLPTEICDRPMLASLKQIIEMKLSTYLSSPIKMLRHKADVVELIRRNDLPRDFELASPVVEEYQIIWDGLNS